MSSNSIVNVNLRILSILYLFVSLKEFAFGVFFPALIGLPYLVIIILAEEGAIDSASWQIGASKLA